MFAEGKQILNDFDIAASVGGKTALVKSYNVTVADGALDLKFADVVEHAIVSAIELVSVAPSIQWQTKTPAAVARFEATSASVNGNL